MQLAVPFEARLDLTPDWREELEYHRRAVGIVLLARVGQIHVARRARSLALRVRVADVALREVAVVERHVAAHQLEREIVDDVASACRGRRQTHAVQERSHALGVVRMPRLELLKSASSLVHLDLARGHRESDLSAFRYLVAAH